uniref:ISXO2-like transposase domain-containing protein n=1 Tax=Octopus bimaculoides TaxID=37653 RepID=A0A0L8GCZ9_OCTBM
MNLLRLGDICKNETSSVTFFQEKGILHQERKCNNGHFMNFSAGSQNRWRCRIRGCRQEQGLRTENWFANSRLSSRKVVLFIYCWTHNTTSIELCDRELEMKAICVVDWNNYLKEVCAAHILANPRVIVGPNMTVEIDESMFSKRKNCVGRLLRAFVVTRDWIKRDPFDSILEHIVDFWPLQ